MNAKKSKVLSGHHTFDLIIIAVSVVVIVFAWVMIAKSFNKYKSVEAELGVQINEFLSNNDYLKILENLESEKSSLTEAYDISRQYISAESDETGIMNLITDSIAKQGGSLSQIRFDNYEKLSNLTKETYLIPFSVTFTCDYVGLVNILDELCLSERLMIIQNVNLVKKNTDSVNNELTVEISAGTFFRPKKVTN
ncbi:MAG TPA: hypothetical protein DDZ89_09680 [Clostridiales bacterium]|nr:hypothetical protein [Clostridiales bacterium]